jgi:hypothetical protein
MSPSLIHILNIVTAITFGASILHTFLPPWEFLNDFPCAQKYYKACVYVVGYIAISGRSTAYKSLSINNPEGVNTTGVSTKTIAVPVEVVTTTPTKGDTV